MAKNSFNVRHMRDQTGLNQSSFWKRVFVTQSGGSRYESGRDVPVPIQMLLTIAFGSKKKSNAAVSLLRKA